MVLGKRNMIEENDTPKNDFELPLVCLNNIHQNNFKSQIIQQINSYRNRQLSSKPKWPISREFQGYLEDVRAVIIAEYFLNM